MNKRDAVLGLLNATARQEYVPAAFFLHFDKSCHRGRPAVEKHLEYFRRTGMDFVKIQYENSFPPRPDIRRPEDWSRMPAYKKDFFAEPLKVVEGIVQEAKREALVVITLYSPLMCAAHTLAHAPEGGQNLITEHIRSNPQAVRKGMEAITESMLLFGRECIRLGVDGFYASTQGGECRRFADVALFNECVKPFDLAVMREINRACIFNILHICDYHDSYDDLTRFLEYPGHVVNCNLNVGSRRMTPGEVSEMFGRPYMGGMERKGIIASGSDEEIRREVRGLLQLKSDKFILGADCTLPNDADWRRIRTAIDAAHEWRP